METETFPICRLYISHMHFGIQKATPARITQDITVSQPRYWWFSSGGIGGHAAGVGRVLPDISNEPNALPSWTHRALTMKALHAFETSVSTDLAIRCHISEDLNPQH